MGSFKIMICDKCKQTHSGSYGSGRFCSAFCARSFSTSVNRSLINQKIKVIAAEKKAAAQESKRPKICKHCQKEYFGRGLLYCSNSCKSRNLNQSEHQKAKMRALIADRNSSGVGWGWKSRKDLPPSYPELFWMKVLDSNKIIYQREFKVQKYFVDFKLMVNDRNIALEIDGSQHLNKDRASIDKEKDRLLKSLGWHVYRIPWVNPNNEARKSIVAGQVKEFLLFLEKF